MVWFYIGPWIVRLRKKNSTTASGIDLAEQMIQTGECLIMS